MIIGVTGGAGYIGSTLIKNLLSSGERVVSLDNQLIGEYQHIREFYSGEKARYIIGDIRDDEILERVFKDVDAIAHLAAIPGLERCREDPDEAISSNIFGTYQVLDVARKNDIPRVVFCSSAAVYGSPQDLPVSENHPLQPLNLYGVTKEAGERLTDSYHINYGMETVNLRFGNIYGVGLYTRWDTVLPKFVKQGLEGNPLSIYGDGEQSRDFVHVEDISRAIELSLTTPKIGGETFNVGGETLTINHLANLIKEIIEEMTGFSVETKNIQPRKRETKEFSYDLSKIKTQLKFQNHWSIKEGIKQIINYHQKVT
jgi:UDP-glucose 4-epimerase